MPFWSATKKERITEVGSICEVCKTPHPYEELIGHHQIPRVFLRKLGLDRNNSPCQLRCYSCEAKMHQRHPCGNPKARCPIREFGLRIRCSCN